MLRDAVRQFEYERERQLRDRVGAISRHVAHDDTERFGLGDIDNVVAGGEHADKAALGQLFKRFGAKRCFI
ncbi:hypothetical protein SDC9_181970 [bioreactor metagenome]|uniref:Uncharacterized protein n=1 Tax=bioreactor metagenome TaxID=1076179 RepID=A0A645H7J9_9ZZZZ